MSEPGRRLSLLCDAAGARFAIPATSVLEVANPDPGGTTLRGHHTLVDLSQLLGGPAEQRPGTAVLLDTSPTLALRVGAVRGARDVADCAAMLHYSERSARLAMACAQRTACAPAFAAMIHICLSSAVAAPLIAHGVRTIVSDAPVEDALLAALTRALAAP